MIEIKYNIQIMSKQDCTMFSARDLTEEYIMISINDSECSTVIYDNPKIIDVLSLTFDDTETLNHSTIRFGKSHINQIIGFVNKYKNKVNNIVVHCTVGISRSGAVGCCLARYLNGSDDYLLATGLYMPNKWVYKHLSKALGLGYSDEILNRKLRLSNKARNNNLKGYGSYGMTLDDMFCDVIIDKEG